MPISRDSLRRPSALIITGLALTELVYRLLREPARRALHSWYSGAAPGEVDSARNGSRPVPPRFP